MFKKIRKQENLGKIKVNAILKTSVRSNGNVSKHVNLCSTLAKKLSNLGLHIKKFDYIIC